MPAATLPPQRRSPTAADHKPFEERPDKWSQRWFDDPPVGTIVYDHERVIYLGNGDWQPLG
jgi:hypothetical protein